MPEPSGWIRVRGARTHNLQSLHVDLPLGRLTVVTGPSGCGKSSLVFDTLFAEGRRRFLETLPGDVRAVFDQLPRPDVDAVDHLPPVLCVSQHAGPPRPRSTLATVTEIHDHLRLLYARLGTPHCTRCGAAVIQHSIADIVRHTLARGEGRKVFLLAPLIRDEPGDHRKVFQQIRQSGFLRARIDGVLNEIRDEVRLPAKERHTVEVVVDRLVVRPNMEERLIESIQTALKHGGGHVVVTDFDDADWKDEAFSAVLACPRCGLSFPELTPATFHFNHPRGACPRCTGFGQVWELDPKRIVPDPRMSLTQILDRLREHLEGVDFAWETPKELSSLGKDTPLAEWPDDGRRLLMEGRTEPPVKGLLATLRELAEASTTEGGDSQGSSVVESLAGFVPCPECQGARLGPLARAVTYRGKALHELTGLAVADALAWFRAHDEAEANEAKERVRGVLFREVLQRLHFLNEVGLGYLGLDRPAITLSGGELQRARLAGYLGGGLLGVCYILDEPTIGLHPQDTERLMAALHELLRRGNTLVVVEHDEAVMRQADWLIDLGPGAGKEGGRLLAMGTVAEVIANPASVTGPWLRREGSRQEETIGRSGGGVGRPAPSVGETFGRCGGGVGRPAPSGRGAGGPAPSAGGAPSVGSSRHPLAEREGYGTIVIRGVRHHNLSNLTVAIPLGQLVCLTGVSGAGKSSLGRDVLVRAARRKLGLLAPVPGGHEGIDGLDNIDKVIEVDQTPLGRSPRSNPATYTGVHDAIRKVFASTRLAKVRGYKASRFSFNVKGGRCEECQGQGQRRLALQWLPDLTVPCAACQGKRFNQATLQVRYKERSIADVLDMPIAEVRDFFIHVPGIRPALTALVEVGLGYLALGQPSNTLSGGEAQRVKLATELARGGTGRTLYFLDEPTTGLHFSDVANLTDALRRLTETGNTVVVIEHNLDVIARADWIIDLRPEATPSNLVIAGTPADVARCEESVTGRYLV